MAEKKLKIGITHGDINGISYEIILKALSNPAILDLFTPVVYGSNKVVAFYKRDIEEAAQLSFNVVNSAADAVSGRANIVNCIDDNVKIEPGKSTALAGQYAVASLHAAVKDLKNEQLDAIVTCPINKANIQSDEFSFIGHTEFFASSCGDQSPLMFMVSENLKVGLVTLHEPLAKVASRITTENILEKLRLMKQSLVRDFAIRQPKIAVMGLNPHAGDCGLVGREEEEIITPAINSAKYEDILAFGPFGSDGFFGKGLYKKFDAVLAMYHDQGLTPFKVITGEQGVNYTAGLSIVRTSPAHGVGYDIVGQGKADPESLRAAIYMAVDICRNRDINNEISANPLQSYSKDNWGSDTSASDIKDTSSEQ